MRDILFYKFSTILEMMEKLHSSPVFKNQSTFNEAKMLIDILRGISIFFIKMVHLNDVYQLAFHSTFSL